MSSLSVFMLKVLDIHIVGRLGSMGILSWKSWAWFMGDIRPSEAGGESGGFVRSWNSEGIVANECSCCGGDGKEW